MVTKISETHNNQVVEPEYHGSPLWRIILFTLNNAATNIYLMAFGYVNYYINGEIGLAAQLVGTLLGLVRLFDGVIDPFIGVFIDKFQSKFGKYRPIMLVGNIVIAISFVMLFNSHHFESQTAKFVMLIISLIVHKVGYSFQQTVTKAGQTALTNDPKQRPLFNIVDGVFTTLVFTGGVIVVNSYLFPRFGEYNMPFFQFFTRWVMIISFVLTILAIIGIAPKDNVEYWGIGEDTPEVKFSDYFDLLRGNKPLRQLAMAAAFVKFNSTMATDSSTIALLFGVVFGSIQLSGQISTIQVIPQILITSAVSAIATRKGLRWSYINSLYLGLICQVLLGLLIWNGNPGSLNLSSINLYTIIFIVIYVLVRAMPSSQSGLALTMAADISDFETQKSGRYVSGMIGTVFSLSDSLASMFAPMAVGWVFGALNNGDLPQPEEPLTQNLRIAAVLLIAALPAIMSFLSILFTNGYKLNAETMERVQARIAAIKRGEEHIGDGKEVQA